LAALELVDDQRAFIAIDVLPHPRVQPRLIEPMMLLDRLGAGELFVSPNADRHS
jgi:hypothetical protein